VKRTINGLDGVQKQRGYRPKKDFGYESLFRQIGELERYSKSHRKQRVKTDRLVKTSN